MNVNNQINKEALIEEIRLAFKNAEFPSHLGLHAARAKDKWITDNEMLRMLTKAQDYPGDWWDIPDKHLADCGSLALNYLDSKGVYYYLPAFMLRAINDGSSRALSPILVFTDPFPLTEDGEFDPWFCDKFSLFGPSQKQATIHFFYYMKVLFGDIPNIENSIGEILESAFWSQ